MNVSDLPAFANAMCSSCSREKRAQITSNYRSAIERRLGAGRDERTPVAVVRAPLVSWGIH